MVLVHTICEDCGAVVADGARFCPASESAACAERTYARYGGALRAITDGMMIWQDDSAAHVRETVDELRREGGE